ncbi:MAG: ATP-dependent Clp protease ATP-binding subunit [Patescibacteria group bacterium]|nr:ATP-dependent Clp protease ATP-binding subunit [Patescibacteria group bacterium]
MNKINADIYYDEPLMRLSHPEKIASSIIASVWEILFVVVTFILLLSTLTALRYAGAFMLLFILDAVFHLFKGREELGVILRKKRANAARFLTPKARNILLSVYGRASVFGGDPLLYAGAELIRERSIKEALLRMDVNSEEVESKVREKMESSMAKKSLRKDIADGISKLAVASVYQAFSAGRKFVEPADLFAALRDAGDEKVSAVFDMFEISSGDLERALIFGRFNGPARLPSGLGGFSGPSFGVRHRYMNRAWTARPTPILDRYGFDLTDLALAGKTGFMVNHEDEYDRLLDILSRPTRPNALLVGDPGIGKETIIGHLAFMISKDEVPAPLFDKRLVVLDISGIVAGADQAEIEKRIETVFREINAAGNIILFIKDVHNLARTGGGSELNAADALIPYIASNDFPTIGTSYPKEYKEFIESNNSLNSAFQLINVRELNTDEAERVLVYDSLILERTYKTKISFAAVKTAVQLAHRYFGDKKLPSSADDLLKEALADVSHKRKKMLDADDIVAVAEKRINVPIHRPGKEEAETLLNMEKIIHERLVDQEQAVTAVARSLREYRSGLSRKGGPIAAFLFVGPTGVGKTELAKILSDIQFGSESAMARFDMSEYQDKQSVFRFIGSPDGSMSGDLTDRIIERPYSLVLLDEFEKAHPDILNLFLQVFDDGRLTDSAGRVADFQNSIIIATSNAHSDIINSALSSGESMDSVADYLKKKLTDVFKPELLNRFSRIIIFKSLSPDDLKSIARLQMAGLASSLKEAQDVDLTYDDEAVDLLVRLGYDPAFGARPLRGVISDKIKSILSEKILSGDIKKGGSVAVSSDGNEFTLKTKEF